MLNLRGLEVACIREVDGNSVRRVEEVTAYYWFFVFFHRIFASCRSFITFTTLFWHLYIMVVIIRVGFRGHSLHLISLSIEKTIRLFKFLSRPRVSQAKFSSKSLD